MDRRLVGDRVLRDAVRGEDASPAHWSVVVVAAVGFALQYAALAPPLVRWMAERRRRHGGMGDARNKSGSPAGVAGTGVDAGTKARTAAKPDHAYDFRGLCIDAESRVVVRLGVIPGWGGAAQWCGTLWRVVL